jgi:predicted transcriptional regulator
MTCPTTPRWRTSSTTSTSAKKKIERGLRDVEAGRVVDQDEAKRRMAKWLGE